MTSSEVANQLEPWFELDDKVVMVTGASSGLGLNFCLDLAKAGCRIVACARRTDRLKSLCEQINQLDSSIGGDHSPRGIAVELDVTSDGRAIETSVQNGWDAFGHIDVLINNAGVRGQVKLSLDLPENEFDQVVKTNLKGSWMVSKYLGSRMRQANRGGSIINISSLSGLHRVLLPGSVAYGSSKAGLDSVTKNMALELGAYNIRVNGIAPGLFQSEMTEGLFHKKWFTNMVKRTVPLGTLGTSDPGLTSLVRYLIHDSSSYVSGNVFIVDSGITLPGSPIYSSF